MLMCRCILYVHRYRCVFTLYAKFIPSFFLLPKSGMRAGTNSLSADKKNQVSTILIIRRFWAKMPKYTGSSSLNVNIYCSGLLGWLIWAFDHINQDIWGVRLIRFFKLSLKMKAYIWQPFVFYLKICLQWAWATEVWTARTGRHAPTCWFRP